MEIPLLQSSTRPVFSLLTEEIRSKALLYSVTTIAGVLLFLIGITTGLLWNLDKAPSNSTSKAYMVNKWVICENGNLSVKKVFNDRPYIPPAGYHVWVWDIPGNSRYWYAITCDGTELKVQQ